MAAAVTDAINRFICCFVIMLSILFYSYPHSFIDTILGIQIDITFPFLFALHLTFLAYRRNLGIGRFIAEFRNMGLHVLF